MSSSGQVPRALTLDADERGFVSDVNRDKFFSTLRAQAENRLCFDCAARNNSWISSTFGIFLCMTCSGHHRNLGARVSFVRSTDLDHIKLDELLRMELGGNARAKTFFRAHSLPDGHPVDYRSKVCDRYRKQLDKQVAELITLHRPNLGSYSSKLREAGKMTSADDGPAHADLMKSNELHESNQSTIDGPATGGASTEAVCHGSDADGGQSAGSNAQTMNGLQSVRGGDGIVKKVSKEVDGFGGSKYRSNNNHVKANSPIRDSGGMASHFHSTARATASVPSFKAKTGDFDFDFDSAFATGAQQQIPTPSFPPPRKASSQVFYKSSSAVDPSPSSATLVRKDLEKKTGISADDFKRNEERDGTNSNFSRFRDANAISSEAFFNREEASMGFEDETATRLSLYSEQAVQKATGIAMAAHETLKSAAHWFGKVSSQSSSNV